MEEILSYGLCPILNRPDAIVSVNMILRVLDNMHLLVNSEEREETEDLLKVEKISYLEENGPIL